MVSSVNVSEIAISDSVLLQNRNDFGADEITPNGRKMQKNKNLFGISRILQRKSLLQTQLQSDNLSIDDFFIIGLGNGQLLAVICKPTSRTADDFAVCLVCIVMQKWDGINFIFLEKRMNFGSCWPPKIVIALCDQLFAG